MNKFNFFGIPILSIFSIEFLQHIDKGTIIFFVQLLIALITIIKMIITKDIKLKDNIVSFLTLILSYLKRKPKKRKNE